MLKTTQQLAWLLLLLNISCNFFRPIAFPDIWWQIDNGRQVVQTFHPPHPARLTFGDVNPGYIDEYCIFEVGLYLSKIVGGLGFLAIAYWLVMMAPFVITYLVCPPDSGRRGLRALALFLACAVAAWYIHQRPAAVGNLFLFILGLGLTKKYFVFDRPRSILELGLLFCFWSNTHSSYLIGLFVFGVYLLETVLREKIAWSVLRQAILVFAFIFLCTGVHPYGVWRWFFTFREYYDPWGCAISQEMWPGPLNFQLMLVAALLIGFVFHYQSGIMACWWVVSSIIMTSLSLTHYRFSNHFAALLLLAFCFPVEPRKLNASVFLAVSKIAVYFLISLCLLIVAVVQIDDLQSLRQSQTPWLAEDISSVPVLQKVELENKKQAVLCDMMVGSYVYDDGAKSLFALNDTSMAQYAQDTHRYYYYLVNYPEAFALALDQLHLDKVVVNHRNPLWAVVLNERKDWHLSFISPDGLLYCREPRTELSADEKRTYRQFLSTVRDQARFSFAAHILPDSEVLDLLKNGKALSEDTDASVSLALSSLPTGEVESFFNHADKAELYPTIQLLILKRLNRLSEAVALSKSWQPWSPNWSEQMRRAQAFDNVGDKKNAGHILQFVYPKPVASPVCEALAEELAGVSSRGKNTLGARLLWNQDSQAWFVATTARWNQHLDQLVSSSQP